MSVFRLSAAVATAAPDTGGLLLATTRGPSTRQPVNRPDTDTTEKMDSETYILQHGHYQIEVMANLDKVPATGARSPSSLKAQ
jgi:hypothetical protein